MFSKTCEYAIRALIYLSAESSIEHKASISAICIHIGAPEHFTAKVLQTLVRNGAVSSQKGANGGFYMSPAQSQKHLIEIVTIIDGDKIFNGCGLGLKNCSETNPCPLHDKFKSIREALKNMMGTTTIAELSKKLIIGKVVLRTE